MRARVRKDDAQPTVRQPAVPCVLRAAATLPRGERVSNPLLGEDVAGTYAVIDLAADEDATLDDARDLAALAKGALLVCDASPDVIADAGFEPFLIADSDLTFGATYTLPDAPWLDAPWLAKAKDDPSTLADPDERRTGSRVNEPGSAGSASSGAGIKLTEAVENALKTKVSEHNDKHGDSEGKRVTLGQLKAVWRRGAGAFSTSHRPSQNRQSWAMARVNAYLKLVASGKPSNPNYVQDNDLLPEDHPRSTRKAAVSKAGKYDHIDFKPPAGVAAAAAKGLEFRRKGGGGGLTPSEASAQGIGSGVARAASLKNRQKQSPKTVRRMAAFFSRHEKNSTIDPKYKSEPWRDRGYVAWLLWGGDPGRAWADKVVAQMNAADEKAEKAMPVLKPFAGFEDFGACVASMRAQGHDDESARAICGRLQADDPAHKADLAIAPGSAGALAPEQNDRLRRVRTKATNEVALIKVDAPDTDERYILGVVLEPDEVDSQGDMISAEEIRDAAHRYMQTHGNVGLQHQTFVNDKIKILESYIAPVGFEIGGQKVKQGTWLMAFRVLDDSIWKAIKSGLLTGLSIGGTGLRMAVP